MSLRTRIVVLIAGIVAAGTAVAASAGYALTRQQLFAEVDRSLRERIVPNGRGPQSARSGSVRPARPGAAGVISQVVGEDGRIVSAGELELPVDKTDVAIAAGTLSEYRARNATVEGRSFRVVTAPTRNGAVQVARDVGEQWQVLDRLARRLLAATMTITAVGAVAGVVLARRLTRPLRRLGLTAAGIAATNDLDSADAALLADGNRRDEIGGLARQFAAMVRSLRASREQQHRLVQDAGHELRTPLTSIRANVELLARAHLLDSNDRTAAFRDTIDEIDELSDLTAALVELAGGGTGTAAEMAEFASVADVVDRAAQRTRRRLEHPVEVRVEDAAHLRLRPQAVERAVTNLLENAGKFAPPGSPIEVDVRQRTVRVIDHGPGIDHHDRAYVFDRFYRATSARSKPGSGLGLAIVAQIVADHRGRLVLEDTPGGGLTIGFELGDVAADRWPLEPVAAQSYRAGHDHAQNEPAPTLTRLADSS